MCGRCWYLLTPKGSGPAHVNSILGPPETLQFGDRPVFRPYPGTDVVYYLSSIKTQRSSPKGGLFSMY